MLSDSPTMIAYRARVTQRRTEKFKALHGRCVAAFEQLKPKGHVSVSALARETNISSREIAEVFERYPEFSQVFFAHNKQVGKSQAATDIYLTSAPPVAPVKDPLLARLKANHKQPA
jgi:hypothetical protein